MNYRFWYSQNHRNELDNQHIPRNYAIINDVETEYTDCYPVITRQYPLAKDRVFLGEGTFSVLEKLNV